MELFSDIVDIIGAVVKIFSAYCFLVLVFALRRERPVPRYAPKTRFAVLIPARNEESVVANLIHSLHTQNYPRELFDVYVLANNCTDDTEGAALRAGARVLKPRFSVRCKGDVLHDSLDVLLSAPQHYEAFLVFDADNLVDPEFLSVTDRTFQTGARVCKGRQMAKNPYDTATAGCYAIWLEMFGRLFNRARSNCGMSARLVGTGFAVHREVLEELGGWNTVTLAEDAEFGAQCATAGHRVIWMPDAITYDEQPNSIMVSLKQRRRWSSGNIHVAQIKWTTLVRTVFTCGSKRAMRADIALLMMTPFIQTLALLPMLYSVAAHGIDGIINAVVTTAIYTVVTTVLTLAIAIWGGYRDVRIFKAALMYPFFMLSWFPLQFMSLFLRTKKWEYIPHNGGRVTFAKTR